MHAPAQPPIPGDMLLLAYRSGIFPMADSRDDPEIFWVEPRKRAIIPLDRLHCSRSLAKLLRQERFTITCNRAFADVIEACAQPRSGHPQSWISGRIADSYRNLHELGHAHSIECWQGEELVGGLYGVGFGGVFCGESMFSRARDTSKLALAWLVASLGEAGASLLDCQFMTEHLASLGAVEISQQDYLQLLSVSAGDEAAASLPEGFAGLLDAAAREGVSPGKLIAQSLTQTS